MTVAEMETVAKKVFRKEATDMVNEAVEQAIGVFEKSAEGEINITRSAALEVMKIAADGLRQITKAGAKLIIAGEEALKKSESRAEKSEKDNEEFKDMMMRKISDAINEGIWEAKEEMKKTVAKEMQEAKEEIKKVVVEGMKEVIKNMKKE